MQQNNNKSLNKQTTTSGTAVTWYRPAKTSVNSPNTTQISSDIIAKQINILSFDESYYRVTQINILAKMHGSF